MQLINMTPKEIFVVRTTGDKFKNKLNAGHVEVFA